MAQLVQGDIRRGRDRLAMQVIAVLVAVTIIPLVVMALLAGDLAGRGLVSAHLDGLRQSANDGAHNISHFIESIRLDGEFLTHTGGIDDYIDMRKGRIEGGVKRAQALDHVAQEASGLLQTRRIYDNFILLDENAREQLRLHFTNGRAERLAESSLRHYPALAENNFLNGLDAPQLVDLDLDGAGGEPSALRLLVPIADSAGRRLGTLVMTLIDGASAHLLDDDLETGKVMVLLADAEGRVISGTLSKDMHRPKNLAELLGNRWRQLFGAEDKVFANLSGYAMATSSVEWNSQTHARWLVVAVQPYSEILAPIRSMQWVMAVLAAVTLGLALLVGLLFSRRLLVDPLGELLSVLRKFRDGDLSARATPHAGELGELASTFNDMADALQRNQLHLEAEVAERTQALQKEMAERQTAQNFLMDAVEAMQDGFLVFDHDERLVLCNSLARQMPPPEIAGQMVPGITMIELLELLAKHGFISMAQGREKEWLTERHDEHRRPHFSQEERLEDGRWLEIRSWRTPSAGSVTVWSDITERKRSQRDLQASERRFRDLFDNMQDAAVVLRAENNGDSFRISDLNHAAQVMDRVDHDHVIGRAVDEVFPALRRLGRIESMGRVWREHRPERLATFFYDDPRAPSWRDMFLFPLSTGEVVAIYRDVTTECQAEEALLRSEERYRILVETMSEGLIVTDPEMVIAYVNDRFAQLAGRSQKDLVGQRLDEAFHPESREMLARWRGRLVFGREEVYEAVLDTGKDRRVDVLVSPAPFYDAGGNLVGKMSVVTDITALKQAQSALRDSESRFRSIFQGAPFGMVLVSGEGQLVEANRAFLAILDIPPNQVIGQPLAALGLGEMLASVSGPGAQSWEGKAALPDGRSVWLRTHVSQVADSRVGPSGMIATVEDVSRRKELEERMAHSSKLMLLGEMSAGLAHEITQPLNVIRLTSEATLARIDSDSVSMDEARGKLKIINEQADRLFDVIDYMQAFSRRESERREPFDLFTSIQAAVALLTESFRQKRIAIATEIPATPCVLLGHARQLEQVILNLLTNARDAIAELHGTTGGTIHITAWRDDSLGRATVLVDDEGKGIPSADCQRIFEPFFSTKGPGKGTGLGLSISLGIVSGLGGNMRAEVAPTGGARFVLDLPLAQISDEAVFSQLPDKDEEQVVPPPLERTSAHVMVVEDEELAASEMADYLTRSGYRVSVYNGGEAALNAFLADPADLVVTDLNMPEGDGRDLIDGLLGDYPYLPIIVVTGRPNTRGGELEEAGSGADVVLRKPIRLRELSEHIGRLLA